MIMTETMTADEGHNPKKHDNNNGDNNDGGTSNDKYYTFQRVS